MYRSFYKTGFLRKLQKLIPSVSKEDLIGSPSGVRAMALGADGEILDDFYFETTENEIHVLNAPSPAATAGLAIGEDRKSTRLNSSHVASSYAVVCLKKKIPRPGRTWGRHTR